MKRREQLKSIFGMADDQLSEVATPVGEAQSPAPDYLRRPASTGAVKAMGLSLDS